MTLANIMQNEAFTPEGQTISSNTGRSVKESRNEKKDFDQYLSAVEKRTEKYVKKNTTPKKEARKELPQESQDDVNQPVQPKNEQKPTEPEKKPDAVQKTEAVNPLPVDNESDVGQEILSAIASILNVPIETVVEWLAELELQPSDLLDPQAISRLLQIALDVKTPAMVLKTPEFQSLFEAVKEAVTEIMTKDDTINPTDRFAQLQGLQLSADEVNGEVVVSQKSTVMDADEQAESVKPVTAALVQTVSEKSNAAETKTAASTEANAEAEDILTAEADVLTHEAVKPANKEDNAAGQNDGKASGGKEDVSINELLPEADAEPSLVPSASFESAVTRAEAVATPQTVAAATATVNPTDVMNQIMNHVRMQSGDQFAELKITLRPENLGDVTLRVITQNGIVTAQFVAENQRVKEVLESNFTQLRDVLQQQGVQISELSVSVRDGDAEERMNQFRQAQQSGRRRLQRISNNVAEQSTTPVTGPMANPADVLLNTVDFTA